jgi:hypothetical protein
MLRNMHFFSTQPRIFLFQGFFCWIFFHVSSTKFSNILPADSSCKPHPFYMKIFQSRTIPSTKNKRFPLSNFRIFSCKMGVSYNLIQLVICLETWLKTHEKKFNKKNLETKKILATRVEKKCTFLSIFSQPQIRNLWNLACPCS